MPAPLGNYSQQSQQPGKQTEGAPSQPQPQPAPQNQPIPRARQPLSLVLFAKTGQEVVRITPDGKVIVNPDFTMDEAARQFWAAVQRMAREVPITRP